MNNLQIPTLEELNHLPIEVDITTNKWGTFSIGDGEDFSDTLNPKADFFIRCEQRGGDWFTLFIPNPDVDVSDWECEEERRMFEEVVVYKTTLDSLRRFLTKTHQRNPTFQVSKREGKFRITDFGFFYLGAMGNNEYLKLPILT